MQMISRAAVIWQLVAFVAVLLPHVGWLPWWLLLICALTPAARLMIHSGRWSWPHGSVKVALVLLVGAGLLVTFSRETGMRATVALLIAGLALKMLEVYRRRDALVLLYVALFVCATAFLFHQSILAALYALLAVTLIVTALNSIYQDPLRNDLMRPLRRALRLLAFSVPLMLVLFVIFPRIGPLWSVPLDRQAARSGLSDEMAPGDISQLTRSAQLAFRATFDSAPPPPEQRYWRSLVLSDFDGRTWRRTPRSERWRLDREGLTETAAALNYEVIFEASNQRWLVALDQPLAEPAGMALGHARTLISDRPIDRRISYRVRSALEYRLAPSLSPRSRAHYLQLPDGGNPQARQLARQWWQHGGGSPTAFVQQALQLFNQQFIYTLSPPALGDNSIDRFLFDTRAGFCGHYAGALTFLLRSAGVPARVVAGYQGGEWNAYEQYLTVRQYDAHAWVEYWSEGEGWVRVDPTAAVAPERIRESADRVFADDPAFLSDAPLARLRFGRDSWLVDLRRQLDALNFNWHRWVLNYQGQQMQLLSGLLGEISALKMALALLVPVALILLIVAWVQLKPFAARPRDPLQRALERLLRELSRRGLGRQPQETLQAYARRIARQCPDLAADLERLAQADLAVRYAGEQGQRQALLDAIKACYGAVRKQPARVYQERG